MISSLPARVRLPVVVRTLALEKKLILPVVPRVRVCPLVVPMVPLPVRDKALFPVPEILAVGVPPATLMKANFAELVALEPSKRSSVVFLSKIVPGVSLKGDPPFWTDRTPVTREVFARLSAEDERRPVASDWTTPRPRLLILILPLFKTVNLLASETEAEKMSPEPD